MKKTLTRYIVQIHDKHSYPDPIYVHSTETSALAQAHARMLYRLTVDVFEDKSKVDPEHAQVLRLCLKGDRPSIRKALELWNRLHDDDDWIRVEEVSYYTREDTTEFQRQALEDYTEWRGEGRRTVVVDPARRERCSTFLLRSTNSVTLENRFTMLGFIAEAILPGAARLEWSRLPALIVSEFERKLTPWSCSLRDLARRMDDTPTFQAADIQLLAAFGYDLQIKEVKK